MKGERQSGTAFPVGLVLGSIVTVQSGAAIATTLFDQVGPAGAVLLRTLFAAVILVAIWRPSLRGHSPEARRATVLFGISLAGMNLCFYEALDRLPLGIAVTLEFVGPLGVAVLSTRRRADFLWAVLAAAGIVLLSGGLGGVGDRRRRRRPGARCRGLLGRLHPDRRSAGADLRGRHRPRPGDGGRHRPRRAFRDRRGRRRPARPSPARPRGGGRPAQLGDPLLVRVRGPAPASPPASSES